MDTCPDCLRPLFQDMIHVCQPARAAQPARRETLGSNKRSATRQPAAVQHADKATTESAAAAAQRPMSARTWAAVPLASPSRL